MDTDITTCCLKTVFPGISASLKLFYRKHRAELKAISPHKPCHHVLRVIITIACSRHDKSENSMRGKQGEGRSGEGAQLHSPIYLISKNRIWLQSVKCIKQTINKREVKSTEEKGVGWGSAPFPNEWYLGTGYDYSQSSVISNKVLTYVIRNLSNL